ncbi:hypothetical protein C8J55DRAFT_566290 [Lentinula edodes]|uniref:Uncharacterized protein n=1 Tax=Lentinula lateritia TaxID=40482 RepID=A0A9W8ZTI6_9AGAR|nr:hypothetical protein C8J55DRAFT_566290 [Lentinula edodes]
MFDPLPPLPPLTESLETKISSEFHQPLASQAPVLFSILFDPLPPSPPLTESLETKIGSEFHQPLASQAVTDMAQCATCDVTYRTLFSIMFDPLPPSPPLTESLETKIGSEFHQPLASQAVAGMAQCATCDVTYRTLFSIVFDPLPPSPPLTESLKTKIGSEFHQPLASQAPALFSILFDPLPPSPPLTESLETKIGSEFHQPLASQAVADMAQCATCDMTYPALFSIMFSPLPPLPPLTESLETKISSEFHQPLASQAVADMAQITKNQDQLRVPSTTCVPSCRRHGTPALFSILFDPLPPSPPLTESLETKIGSEFHQPLASQAVADMAHPLPPLPPLTESLETKISSEFHQPLASQAPALFSILFDHLPPSPPLTESLETKIGSEFHQPLASQAVAGMAQCATCDVTYCTLFSIMFDPLPPSPPLTESLETKIGSEFHQPLASQAVAGMAQCATCDVTYRTLFSIVFDPLPPSPPLTESLKTKIGSEFHQPLASQAVADMAQCAGSACAVFNRVRSPTTFTTTHRITKNQDRLRVPSTTCIPSCRRHGTPALFSILFDPLPPSPPLTESLETKIGSEFHQPLASQAVTDMAQCATCDVTYCTLFSIMFDPLPPSPPLTESLETVTKRQRRSD